MAESFVFAQEGSLFELTCVPQSRAVRFSSKTPLIQQRNAPTSRLAVIGNRDTRRNSSPQDRVSALFPRSPFVVSNW